MLLKSVPWVFSAFPGISTQTCLRILVWELWDDWVQTLSLERPLTILFCGFLSLNPHPLRDLWVVALRIHSPMYTFQ